MVQAGMGEGENIMEFIKGAFGFITFVSWAYTTTALVACQSADLPYPDWFYPASAVAVVTFFVLIGVLVYDILTSGAPGHRGRRARRRKNRCLGMVRYVDGGWVCVPDVTEDEEN